MSNIRGRLSSGGGPMRNLAQGGEKPKDFYNTIKKLLRYLIPNIFSIASSILILFYQLFLQL
jgi:hypothetical protein